MPIEAASSDAQIAAWNDYVANHPQATPYHQYAWLQSVAGAYRHQTRALMAYSDKVVTGVLPLVVMSMPLVSNQAVSLLAMARTLAAIGQRDQAHARAREASALFRRLNDSRRAELAETFADEIERD